VMDVRYNQILLKKSNHRQVQNISKWAGCSICCCRNVGEGGRDVIAILSKLKAKDIYYIILENKHDCIILPNTQIYWQNKYKIDVCQMQTIYKIPYMATCRTHLQALQYKVLHKIINCNFWLHKITINDTPRCRFCREDETVEHYFYGCKITKHFWYAFQTWWNIHSY
jgi:hypothetical protein